MSDERGMTGNAATDDLSAYQSISAILRGWRPPPAWTEEQWLTVVDVAVRHRVDALLRGAVHESGTVPGAVIRRLDELYRQHAAREVVQRRELQQIGDAFASSHVPALLVKGAALAYTVYDRPELRPRQDTDVLIADTHVATVEAVLRDLGYVAAGESLGRVASTQRHYTRVDATGSTHHLDLHWRLANPQRFRDAVDFAALAASSIPLPRLSPAAHGLCTGHALLVACLHRIAHHLDRTMLLWIYDVDRLARTASDADWETLDRAASAPPVRRACVDGLQRALALFGTPVPPKVLARLEAGAAPGSSLFMRGRLRQIDVLRDDLMLASWTDRARLVVDHLFPPAEYMRRAYAPGSRLPLPLLYGRRIVAGAPKWFRRAPRQ